MAEPTKFDVLLARWQTVPRWVLIIGIAGAVGLGYWIYKSTSNNSQNKATQQWNTNATNYLVSQGYTRQDASNAINAYTNGQQLSPSQVSLIAAAIGSVGTPDSVTQNSAVTAQLSDVNTGTGVLSPSGTTQPTSGTTGSATSYWRVPVGSAGWSTTFRGIGSQFGVDPSTVQQANPNLSPSVWGRLPYGAIVKVPRPNGE